MFFGACSCQRRDGFALRPVPVGSLLLGSLLLGSWLLGVCRTKHQSHATPPPDSEPETWLCCVDSVRLAFRRPLPQAPASAALCSLPRLWVMAIKCHSLFTFSRPLNRKRFSPLAALIWPNTGSTIVLRRA